MSDSLPTVWRAEPHTLAKHTILKTYLQAWMAILSRQTERVTGATRSEILYVDGFAGPGIYEGGEPGSPIIAVTAALEHSRDLPTPIHFVFIEEREDRFGSLQRQLRKVTASIDDSALVRVYPPIYGDCSTRLTELLDDAGSRFGPAMVFLDQSGYSSVSITLIRRVLSHPQCEVFSFLNWDHMNRFMTDDNKWEGITRAYGSNDWRAAIEMAPRDREQFMLREYKSALIEKARARYTLEFALCGDGDKLLSWLFFSTNNLRGLEEMKKAMWKADDTGCFVFTDKDDPGQRHLLAFHSQEWLADELTRRLAGRTKTIEQLQEYVLVETPCYRFVEALRRLEKMEDKIALVDPPSDRRTGSFLKHKNMRVRFL